MTDNEIIDKLKEMATSYNHAALANVVLDNEKFRVWSGSGSPLQHHYGRGGLLRHTWEVVTACLNNYKLNDQSPALHELVTEDQLFFAALYHDFGKIYDYAPRYGSYDVWEKTEHARKIHHVNRSVYLWWSAAETSYPQDSTENVAHAILAHHGRPEWGSPITPQTQLAWLLHLCDSMSARLNDWEKHIEKPRG